MLKNSKVNTVGQQCRIIAIFSAFGQHFNKRVCLVGLHFRILRLTTNFSIVVNHTLQNSGVISHDFVVVVDVHYGCTIMILRLLVDSHIIHRRGYFALTGAIIPAVREVQLVAERLNYLLPRVKTLDAIAGRNRHVGNCGVVADNLIFVKIPRICGIRLPYPIAFAGKGGVVRLWLWLWLIINDACQRLSTQFNSKY